MASHAQRVNVAEEVWTTAEATMGLRPLVMGEPKYFLW